MKKNDWIAVAAAFLAVSTLSGMVRTNSLRDDLKSVSAAQEQTQRSLTRFKENFSFEKRMIYVVTEWGLDFRGHAYSMEQACLNLEEVKKILKNHHMATVREAYEYRLVSKWRDEYDYEAGEIQSSK